MTETLPQTEGRIPFKGHSTWYTIVGEGEEPGKAPLLLLHGGPGGAHDYMESMGELARGGRRVIMYDQLGCGKSPVPSNPAMWTVELFVEEVDVVRQALGLERLHILGQSWGGMLGMEYALTQPEGVESMVICDSPARMDLWVEEANRLRAELPPDVQATLLEHELAGTTDDPAYEEACLVFYNRHVCRVPWSDSVSRSLNSRPAITPIPIVRDCHRVFPVTSVSNVFIASGKSSRNCLQRRSNPAGKSIIKPPMRK